MSKKGSFSADLDGVTVTVRASSRRVATNKICAKTGRHVHEVESRVYGGHGARSGAKPKNPHRCRGRSRQSDSSQSNGPYRCNTCNRTFPGKATIWRMRLRWLYSSLAISFYGSRGLYDVQHGFFFYIFLVIILIYRKKSVKLDNIIHKKVYKAMEVKSKKLDKSQIELEFELTAEEFAEHFEHALEHLKHHVKVDGFREGKAPATMVEDKLKPEMLLMEAGDHAVQHVYTDYIKENKLEPVGQPEVQIKKIAKGSEFIFTAIITVLPDVELPNYKEIAKAVKGKEITVTEEEIQDSINYLQKTRAKFTLKNETAENKDFVEIKYQSLDIENNKEIDDKFILGEGGFMKGFEEGIIGMKSGDEKEINVMFPETTPRKDLAGKESQFKIKMVSVQKMELPEIDDEFAKQLGAFDSLDALKVSMKEGIRMEKSEEEKQRVRGEILEKIAEKSKFEMPVAMVEYEKERLLEDLKNKISQSIKISFEEYLASIKKTEQEIKETYQKEAEKRLRGFLILRELGKKESIEVSDEEVAEEVAKSVKNYSKEQLAKIDINELKEYTKGVIKNEKIFQMLEDFSK